MADRDKSDHLSFYYQRSGGPWNFLRDHMVFRRTVRGSVSHKQTLRGTVKKSSVFFFPHSPPFPSLEPRHACYISQIGVNHSKSIGRMWERCM